MSEKKTEERTRSVQKTTPSSGAAMPLLALFLCLTLVLGGYTLLRRTKGYSETENRALAAFPSLSAEGLWDGSFGEGAGKWFADRFAGREWWRQMGLALKRAVGIRENGGVLLGDERLYLLPETPDEDRLTGTLDAVNAFAEKYEKVNCFVCVAPNATEIYRDVLPKKAAPYDQAALLARLKTDLPSAVIADVSATLSDHRDEYIFYRTDHHWTSLGAYYAFCEVRRAMGLPEPVENYKIVPFAEDFEGTLSAKSADRRFRDQVDLWLPETEELYSVTYTDSMKKTPSLYYPDAKDVRDSYTVFFGGNHPRVDIDTTADTGRNLLVFKDSYFNAFAQFIWPYFEKIVVVDPRYDDENVSALISREGITDVLFLYNADTFANDPNLAVFLADGE